MAKGGTHSVYLSAKSLDRLEKLKQSFNMGNATGFSTILNKLVEDHSAYTDKSGLLAIKVGKLIRETDAERRSKNGVRTKELHSNGAI